MANRCVVIGGSHAAAQLVISLRTEGWDGEIVIVTEDAYIPYRRPPLSKEYLSGEKSMDDIKIRSSSAYEKVEVQFKLNTKVISINREKKTVSLSCGEELSYSKLALTTGAQVRKLTTPGSNLPGVCYLRDAADVEVIRRYTRDGGKAVIVGGGYIGLETAAVFRKLGMSVTLLEAGERILQRVTTEKISRFYQRIHTEEGVNVVTGASLVEFVGDDQVRSVRCGDGTHYDADLVVVGIGVLPRQGLAEDAGLEVGNGIVVNEFAETSDPDIVAAGDCAFHRNSVYDREMRIESVQNAMEQAKVAAATICGNKKPYEMLPTFWSNQYDLKLQIAGLSQGYDEVVIRGEIEKERKFTAFYLKEGRLLALDAVNRPKDFMMGKKLILGKSLDKAALADDSVSLKELA